MDRARRVVSGRRAEPGGVLLLNAVTFLVSAALLTFLPSPKRDSPTGTTRGSFLDDTLAGLRYIWATPIVRTIGLGFFAIVAFNGIDDVALVFLVGGAGGLLATLAVAAALRHSVRKPRTRSSSDLQRVALRHVAIPPAAVSW